MSIFKASTTTIDKAVSIFKALSVFFIVMAGLFGSSSNKPAKDNVFPTSLFDGPNRAYADIPYSQSNYQSGYGSCNSCIGGNSGGGGGGGGGGSDCTSANCVGGCSNSDGSSGGSNDSGSTSGSCGASTSSGSAGGCGCNGSGASGSSGTGCGLY